MEETSTTNEILIVPSRLVASLFSLALITALPAEVLADGFDDSRFYANTQTGCSCIFKFIENGCSGKECRYSMTAQKSIYGCKKGESPVLLSDNVAWSAMREIPGTCIGGQETDAGQCVYGMISGFEATLEIDMSCEEILAKYNALCDSTDCGCVNCNDPYQCPTNSCRADGYCGWIEGDTAMTRSGECQLDNSSGCACSSVDTFRHGSVVVALNASAGLLGLWLFLRRKRQIQMRGR